MSQIYMKNRAPQKGVDTPRKSGPGPSTAELAAGARPTSEQLGSRVDLPGEIREKMESSFGADFSNVKLYESAAVADAGAQAVTQGSSIAFAPDGGLKLTGEKGTVWICLMNRCGKMHDFESKSAKIFSIYTKVKKLVQLNTAYALT